MQQSKTGYYADFAIYIALLAVLIGIGMFEYKWPERLNWLAAAGAGALWWTLIEYALHRFAFHGMPIVVDMHAVHHASPRAYLGTPTWLSLAIVFVVIFLPASRVFSPYVASGLTAGVVMGFLWYGFLHHVIHHRRPRMLALRMTGAARRHHLHHGNGTGNFGVTTEFWDHVFGTVLQ